MALAVRQQTLGSLTYHEVQRFPDDGLRYELVHGELLVTPAPRRPHQRCIHQLEVVLERAIPPDLEVLPGPIDWYVDEQTYFEPDVVVVRRDALWVDEQRLTEPPILAVEVMSPTTWHRDEHLKVKAYAEAGLRWYWVVDPAHPRLTVRRLVDGELVEQTVVVGGSVYETGEPFPVAISPAALVR